MKKELLVTMSTGFALFSMFFGSGNLVFPISVGLESDGHYFAASLGILCTCVLFPLLGMVGITLYKGNLSQFFGCFGKKGVFLFSLLALSLMGPFGVLARCLTVIHGALQLLLPGTNLVITSLAMCVVIYFLTANKTKIVSILGNVLTPLLLAAITCVVVCSLYNAPMPESVGGNSNKAFTNGFFTGYQTMDLVAAFFFSGFVLKELHNRELFVKAAFVGAALLYVVYLALALLGWLYAPLLASTPPQELLGTIALAAVGSYAAPLVCAVVILACITTAIALTSLFSEFLRTEVCQEKLSNKLSLVLTLAVAFFVSNLEFAGIANFLGPILDAIYPALIMLTIFNIACKIQGFQATHWPFTATVVTKYLWV